MADWEYSLLLMGWVNKKTQEFNERHPDKDPLAGQNQSVNLAHEEQREISRKKKEEKRVLRTIRNTASSTQRFPD